MKLKYYQEQFKPRKQHMSISAGVLTNLLWLANNARTEVASALIATEDDPLRIKDLVILPQIADACSFEMNEDALERHMLDFEDTLPLASYYRVWAHTHPRQCPAPSQTDWDNFDEFIRPMPWGVMFIIGTKGATSATLYVKALDLTIDLPVIVDYNDWDGLKTPEVLAALVASNVTEPIYTTSKLSDSVNWARALGGYTDNTLEGTQLDDEFDEFFEALAETQPGPEPKPLFKGQRQRHFLRYRPDLATPEAKDES